VSFQRPAKVPPIGHPIDLDERMLDDLSRLFYKESDEKAREAERLYRDGNYTAGALAELASDGLDRDSREIARLAFVKFRFRHGHDERNLLPWQRGRPRPPSPF
jgi:hypothetical protein